MGNLYDMTVPGWQPSSSSLNFDAIDTSTAETGSSGIGDFMSSAGTILSVFGAINGAIGAFYSAKNAQDQIKLQQSKFGYQMASTGNQYTSQGNQFQSQYNTYLSSQNQYKSQQIQLGISQEAEAFQLTSQKMGLKNQASTLDYQASISDLNATQAELHAEGVLLAGERAIGIVTAKSGQQQADQRASMAARGIVLGDGSAKEVVASTDLAAQVDALTINANAVQAAEASRTAAVSYKNDANFKRVQAQGISAYSDAINPNVVDQRVDSPTLAQVKYQNVFNTLDITSLSAPMFNTDTISPTGMTATSVLGRAASIAKSWYRGNATNPSDAYYLSQT